jgi:hypothetical protein
MNVICNNRSVLFTLSMRTLTLLPSLKVPGEYMSPSYYVYRRPRRGNIPHIIGSSIRISLKIVITSFMKCQRYPLIHFESGISLHSFEKNCMIFPKVSLMASKKLSLFIWYYVLRYQYNSDIIVWFGCSLNLSGLKKQFKNVTYLIIQKRLTFAL